MTWKSSQPCAREGSRRCSRTKSRYASAASPKESHLPGSSSRPNNPLVALPRQIVDAQIGGELLQLGESLLGPVGVADFLCVALLRRGSVIKQPDRELVGRIIDGFRRRHGVGKQVRLFVVGRNEYIDGGKAIVRLCPGRARRQRLGDHEEAERKHQHAVHLRHVKQKSGNEVFRLIDRRQRSRGAPVDVSQHDRCAEGEGDQPPNTFRPQELQDHHSDEHEHAGDELRLETDRQGDQGNDRSRCQRPDQDHQQFLHRRALHLRISQTPDSDSAKSRTAVSLSPGQLAEVSSRVPGIVHR